MRGRKPTQESRAAEFRQRLIAWKQTPGSLRPSLRGLARELRTSHQLLKYFLDGMEKWKYKERHSKATEESDQILFRAIDEGRPMTEQEQNRRYDCAMTAIRAKVCSIGLHELARLKQVARRGPLHPAQFKMLKIFAKQGFPGAQELLQKCSQLGVKERNRFSEIVKETSRHECETYNAWVRRIWDECDKYDTKCPRVITEELLQKWSQDNAKKSDDNLPAISMSVPKSFETVSG
jgi:hypothetical protein